MKRMCRVLVYLLVLAHFGWVRAHSSGGFGEQPLSKIAIHKATFAFRDSASIKAYPFLLGLKVQNILCKVSI